MIEHNQDNWSSHLPMLFLAAELTESANGIIIELGSGHSTSLIKSYCDKNNRPFESFDNNKDWAEKTGAVYIEKWGSDLRWVKPCSVLLVDHAPGEHRVEAIKLMDRLASVIVVHDTEEVGAGDYGFKKVWPLFKHRLSYKRNGPGAGATMVSNYIDLKPLEGGQYELEYFGGGF